MRMKHRSSVIISGMLLSAFLLVPGKGYSQLFINEFMAKNKSGLKDNHGKTTDWIEIYNAGNATVNIGGYCISDSVGYPCKCRIPSSKADSTTIKAHGFIVLYADGTPAAGVRHLSFRLSKKGEILGLYRKTSTGTELVDVITFKSQVKDISYGRVPDGSNNWKYIQTPSPGSSNNKAKTGKPAKKKSSKDGKKASKNGENEEL